MKIKEKFQEIYDANIEDYGDAEKFKSDLLQNGCVSGMVSELIYYKDTVALYDEFEDECDEWLNEQIEQTGLRPDQLFRYRDNSINSDLNKNIVIWAMFEEFYPHARG